MTLGEHHAAIMRNSGALRDIIKFWFLLCKRRFLALQPTLG
jgi:hypothetical protein